MIFIIHHISYYIPLFFIIELYTPGLCPYLKAQQYIAAYHIIQYHSLDANTFQYILNTSAQHFHLHAFHQPCFNTPFRSSPLFSQVLLPLCILTAAYNINALTSSIFSNKYSKNNYSSNGIYC